MEVEKVCEDLFAVHSCKVKKMLYKAFSSNLSLNAFKGERDIITMVPIHGPLFEDLFDPCPL